MSTSFRPCLHCDYLLPSDGTQPRCPECGNENYFAEIEATVQSAFASPMRTILSGRIFSIDLLRKVWRATSCNPATSRKLAIIALLAGLLLPAAMLTTTAAISLKTTVQCNPHLTTHLETPQGLLVQLCSPYHRPPYLDYNYFDWQGWRNHTDQNERWASMAILLNERIDRTVIDRSIVLTPTWTFINSQALTKEIVLIATPIGVWWVLAAMWFTMVRIRTLRTSPNCDTQASISPNLKALCYLVLSSSGILLTVLLAVELTIRLTVPEFGIAHRGNQWHNLRSYLPWAGIIPVLFLWQVSRNGPPGIARWAQWSTLAVAAVGTYVVGRIARLRIPTQARMKLGRLGTQ